MAKYLKYSSISVANIQSTIGISLYLLSFAFIGFYSKSFLEPSHSFNLLLWGWAGVPLGHLSWLANPIFVIAIFQKKNQFARGILSLVALLLSLSFLLHQTIPSYAGGIIHHTITGYGLGYYLWVLGISFFFFGQISTAESSQHNNTIFTITVCTVQLLLFCLGSFYFHKQYSIGEHSPKNISNAREQYFDEYCPESTEEIYANVNNVKGIFFGPKTTFFNQEFLRSGAIEFFETENSDKNGKPYLRYSVIPATTPPKHPKMLIVEVDDLGSDYKIIANALETPPKEELLIRVQLLSIVSTKTNSIVARSSSVKKINSFGRDKYCGTKMEFIYDALNLKNNRYISTNLNRKEQDLESGKVCFIVTNKHKVPLGFNMPHVEKSGFGSSAHRIVNPYGNFRSGNYCITTSNYSQLERVYVYDATEENRKNRYISETDIISNDITYDVIPGGYKCYFINPTKITATNKSGWFIHSEECDSDYDPNSFKNRNQRLKDDNVPNADQPS